MAHLIELDGVRPTIGEDVFLHAHVGRRTMIAAGGVVSELRRRYLAAGAETVGR